VSNVPTLAFIDDYPRPLIGHHPDFLIGLAEATLNVASDDGTTRIYCPPRFLAGRSLSDGIIHQPTTRNETDTSEQQHDAMEAICRSAADVGVDVLVNLYLDESHQAFPVQAADPRIVQTLHRPVEFAEATRSSRRVGEGMRGYLERLAPDDIFVVHTRAAHAEAREWVQSKRLLQLPWPAASQAELAARFAHPPPSKDDRHALLIGDARPAKGIHELLTAVERDGLLLRIVGQQPKGFESELRHRYPAARVEWENGWISHARLSEALLAASVVVFPYLETFGRHGGASGALAQALTHAKPLIVSSVLADQVVESDAVRFVEPGDVEGLREAIHWALANTVELHHVARSNFEQVRSAHTYERYVERMVECLAE
jgi:glycosyltransferase involved in cell wall biosynthesis